MRRLRYLAAAVVIAGFVGCGGDGLTRVPVEGRVMAMGVPVGNATVSFIPKDATKGEGGIGTTDADGNFTLTGSRRGDTGVVAGKYQVIVSRYIDRDGTVLADYIQADNPLAIESVPVPFSTTESPLEVTVPEEGGKITVEIPAKLIVRKK